MENFTNWCIIILLIIAIIYALILNFRLSAFKKNSKEIQKNIQSFNQIVQNAETTLSQLQKRTQNVIDQLKIEINHANQLRDDLILILDKSQHLQEKQTFHTTEAHRPSKAGVFSKSAETSVNLYQSDAEKELYVALQKIKQES